MLERCHRRWLEGGQLPASVIVSTHEGQQLDARQDHGRRQRMGGEPSVDLLGAGELLAFVGRSEDARRELATLEPSPATAFEHASLIQYIDWLDTGASGLDDLRRAAGMVGGDSGARRAADVTVALAEARERAVRNDAEWFAPLEAVRGRLGLAPRRVVLRDTWGKAGVASTLVAFIAAMGASLLRFLL